MELSSEPRHTILLIEDDHDDQELLISAFQTVDPTIKVQAFDSGWHALAYIDNEYNPTPSLIVLDYNMPDMTGVDVLKQMNRRNRCKAIQKVMYSTSNNPWYIKESRKEGVATYMIKPAQFSAILEDARCMITLCSM